MCPNALQYDGQLAGVFDDSKDDTKIVTDAACPGASQHARHFVCTERRMEGIIPQLSKSFEQVRGMVWMAAQVFAGDSYKSCAANERQAHPTISCMSSSGVTTRHRPALNSRFASRISLRKAVRRCSITRLESISTRDSFCDKDNPSVNPTILSNVIPFFIAEFYGGNRSMSTRCRHCSNANLYREPTPALLLWRAWQP